ncbi:MAG: rhodanese-like domain-containing protein [Anaerolineales bacterium]
MKSTSLRKVINIRTTAFLILLILGSVIAACAPSADVASPEVVSGLIDAQTYNQRFVDGEDHLLIDVRTPEEFASGHIPGAINISVQSLPDRLDEVPNDETIVVYCRTGNRSATATDILVDAGYAPVYDLGGIVDWVSAGYPVEY